MKVIELDSVLCAGALNVLRKWLVASLLKPAKIWCQCMLNNTKPGSAHDLPSIV